MLVGHIKGTFISFFRKILRKLLIFLENVILVRLTLVNLRPKNSETNNFQTKLIWQHLFYIRFPFKWYTIYEII